MGLERAFALNRIKFKVKSLVREGRLVFLEDNKCQYTNKDGFTQELSFDGMVNVFLNAGGIMNFVQADISADDIRKYIIEAYQKEVKSK